VKVFVKLIVTYREYLPFDAEGNVIAVEVPTA